MRIGIVGIYKVASPSGKIYIGQSWDIKARWSEHGVSKKTPLLYNSINYHGKDKHIFEIIHELPTDIPQSVVDQLEMFYIQLYKECGFELLNLHYGGRGGKLHPDTIAKRTATLKKNGVKRKWSEESKRKQSERYKGQTSPMKGKKHSAEALEKISAWQIGRISPMKNKKHADESRLKMTIAHLGKKLPEETCKKLSLARMGNKNCLGRKLTEEHKKKCSIALTGRKHSEETKKKISEANKKYVFTDEHRKKMSEAGLMNWAKKKNGGTQPCHS